MSDQKIKVKELALEMNVSTKDLLRVLRELNITAKSTMSSISVEELPSVRAYFTNLKTNNKEEVKQVQPGVVLRRKRQTAKKDITESKETIDSTPKTSSKELDDIINKSSIKEKQITITNTIEKESQTKENFTVAKATIPSKSEETSVSSSIEISGEQNASQKSTKNIELSSKNIVSKKQPEKTGTPIRKPAASAQPEGSSAPSLLPPVSEQSRRPHEDHSLGDTEDTINKYTKKESSSSQVRVISKPNFVNQDSKNTYTRTDQNHQEEKPYRKSYTDLGQHKQGQRNTYTSTQTIFPTEPMDMPSPGTEGQSKKKRFSGKKNTNFTNTRYKEDDDGTQRPLYGKKRHKQHAPQITTQPLKATKRKIRVEEAIRVADMAHQMGLKASEIIKILFNLGFMATINKSLDIDTATIVAAEFGYEIEKVGFAEEDYLTPTIHDTQESLKLRPPVVTIMGHVDHGKTSLLDAIRKTNVTGGEAGGITQHIGAYHVTTKSGEIVFLDTPGHEAFTTMRARGAQVTDIVVLVVAADDGVMEQTREAVNHAKAANVPIMVAVNKIDKLDANPDHVLRELSEIGLVPEDWGGETIVVKVSAKTGEGIDELLELLALQAEVLELKANPDKPAKGHIIEAKLDKGRGPIATVLIQEGTLQQGDTFICGVFSGRVRAMFNDQGKKTQKAGPSIPIEVQGFEGVPEAGEVFTCLPDEKLARRIAESRAIKQRERVLAKESRVTLETFLSKSSNAQEVQMLNLVVKSDVQGSLGAIIDALHKLSTEKVSINIVHGGSGAITESDVLLASASDAIIIGFNVRPTPKVKEVAEHEHVDIRFYDIIYKLVEEIKNAMVGLLAPISREVYLGQAEVRETFTIPKIGTIAGSHISDGKFSRNAEIRLLREGVVIYTGKISSLKRFKDDVKEVQKGYECGIGIENYNDIKVGDVVEAFETVKEAATL